jgi:hypothetical protein
MKRTLLTLALVASAGAAGAQTATAPITGNVNATPGVGTSAPAAGMTNPPMNVPPGGGATLDTNATMNSNTGVRGPVSGGAQMNTNAQMNSNAQMNNQMNNQMGSGQMNSSMGASGSAGASTNANMATAPAPRLTGAAGTAQRRIEQDGYKNVQNLQRGDDGLWRGTAMRGNTQVQVAVDRAGNVSAQ